MGKLVLALIGASLFVACAAGNRTPTDAQGIFFETQKSRRAVMDAIIQVATDDGFTVSSDSEKDGKILFNPREMLDGILSEKISERDWNIQSKRAALNRLIQVSAIVGTHGGVELKTLVMVSGLNGPVDTEKSEKLARYYEEKIMKALRTSPPKLLMRMTDTTA